MALVSEPILDLDRAPGEGVTDTDPDTVHDAVILPFERPGELDSEDDQVAAADRRLLIEIVAEEESLADRRFEAALGKQTVQAADKPAVDPRVEQIDRRMAGLLMIDAKDGREYRSLVLERAAIIQDLLKGQ